MQRFALLALAFEAAAAQLAGSLYNGGVIDRCSRGLTSLYPFGAAAGDLTGTPGDDATAGTSVWVGTPFKFLGVNYNAFSFSTNGWLTFNSADPTTYVPVPFPTYPLPGIALWWMDQLCTPGTPIAGYTNAVPGNTYFRPAPSRSAYVPSDADKARMAADVAAAFPSERAAAFNPTFVAVVTYFSVAAYSGPGRNTFQVAFASDAFNRSYATLCFDTLTYGTSNAAVGFNGVNSAAYYNLPLSRTPTVTQLSCGGNGGCYTFRVDGSTIVAPAASPTGTPSPSQVPSTTQSQTPSFVIRRSPIQAPSRIINPSPRQIPSVSPLPLSSGGTCGPVPGSRTLGTTCGVGGGCCSQYGWCGTGPVFCGAGCLGTPYGDPCMSIAPSASASQTATPVPLSASSTKLPSPLSTNGNCGPSYGGTICPPGTGCCSTYGWCGVGATYCGTGCLPGFGDLCDSQVLPTPTASPSMSSTPSVTPSRSLSESSSWVPSSTQTTSQSSTVTASQAVSPSRTPTASVTRGATPSSTGSGASTPSPTPSWTGTVSQKASGTQVGTGSVTPTASGAPTPSRSPSMTPSASTSARPTTTTVPGFVIAPGTIIYNCSTPGVVALTFDDGPFAYTQGILDLLNAANMKATFFQNSNNWACVYDYYQVVRNIDASGHQLASHTFSHADLATLTQADVALQLTMQEPLWRDMIGKVPLFMRPPYGSHNAAVKATLESIGYINVLWNLDSLDSAGATFPQEQVQYNTAPYGGSGNIILNHDVQVQTFRNLTAWVITWVRSRNLRAVTVGECLGVNEWYRGYTATLAAANIASKTCPPRPSYTPTPTPTMT